MSPYADLDERRTYHREYGRSYMKRWVKTPAGRFYRNQKHMRHRYGLELFDFMRILERQRYRCPVCDKSLADAKRLAIDHDHQTGRTRGVLHIGCNSLLGWFENNRSRLISYVGDQLCGAT
mgnify:FL=1